MLSSSRGQANFRGLEASEAKDLTFEAKDFKMCPRGQGRPRGLHLWCVVVICINFCISASCTKFKTNFLKHYCDKLRSSVCQTTFFFVLAMLLVVRILIHNGLGLFAAWATIATVVGFTIALVYIDSPDFDSAQLRGESF